MNLNSILFHLQASHGRTPIWRQHYHTTECLFKRSVKASKPRRRLEGEDLENHLDAKKRAISEYAKYKCAVAEIAHAFKEERKTIHSALLNSEGILKTQEKREREEQRERLTIVAESNQELKARRLQREEEKAHMLQLKLQQAKMASTEKEAQALHLRTAMVKQAIMDSNDFVRLSNLEQKISECLSSEVNYNFALGKDGSIALSTKPPGNYDTTWCGPGPAAFQLGGFTSRLGEWDFVFKQKKDSV